jgi:cytochrome P450
MRSFDSIKNVREFYKDPIAFLFSKDYGAVCSFKMLHLKFHHITGPDAVKQILVTNHKKIIKTPNAQYFTSLAIGEGLVSTDGDTWIKKRKEAVPAFHTNYINDLMAYIITCTEHALATYNHNNGAVNLNSFMLSVTLQVISKVSFGTVESQHIEFIEKSMEILITEAYKKVVAPFNLPLFFPTKSNLRFNKHRLNYHKIVEKMTKKSLLSPQTHVLSWKLANLEKGQQPNEDDIAEVCNSLKTIIAAGHETTATTLTWLVYEVEKNQAVKKELLTEIQSISITTNSDSKSLFGRTKFTQQVIKETLRLYPSIWLMGRMATEAFTVNGVNIKKGDNILISPYYMHRTVKYWDRPEQFDPGRFVNDSSKDEGHYFPFGMGPRQCIGNHLAMMEMIIILVQLYSKYTISISDVEKVAGVSPYVTLRPDSNIKINLSSK